MKAPKSFFKDCLQVEDVKNQDAVIQMQCGLNCYKCGFNRQVAAERKRRIKAGDFRERNGISYLYVGEDYEQSDFDGSPHERPGVTEYSERNGGHVVHDGD